MTAPVTPTKVSNGRLAYLRQELALRQQLRNLRRQHDVPVLVHVCKGQGRDGESGRS